jgi:capsular polysaccharide biosynthesis protein
MPRMHDQQFAVDEAAQAAANNIYDVHATKRSLVGQFGVAEGFARYRQHYGLPEQAEIRRLPLAPLRHVAERLRAAFVETAPGEAFVIPPPVVVGDGAVGPLTAHARSSFVACLVDACVRAGSSVIEAGGYAVLDYEGDELARIDDRIDVDPAIFHASPQEVWIIGGATAAATVEIDEAFSLLGLRSRVFGHWMLEYLPKYFAARLSGALPPVPLLIEAGLPKTHRQALALLLGEEVPIIELPWPGNARLRRLWCAPWLAYIPVFASWERFRDTYLLAAPPGRYAPVVREMARRADRVDLPATGADRLFLAREPAWHDVVNQAALIAAAEARGFLTVYPNRLNFAEQVALVRHAQFIVGPAGGAMYLAFFARPGTQLCMFRYCEDVRSAQTDMTGIFAEIGVEATVLTGPLARLDPELPPASDFAIDTAAFCRFLDGWLQR